MITIYFGSCPKCKGDVEASIDEYHNKVLKCLQCSFTVSTVSMFQFRHPIKQGAELAR